MLFEIQPKNLKLPQNTANLQEKQKTIYKISLYPNIILRCISVIPAETNISSLQ